MEVKAITNKYCEELIDIANLRPILYKDRPVSFPLEKKSSYYATGSTMIFIKEEKIKEFKFDLMMVILTKLKMTFIIQE